MSNEYSRRKFIGLLGKITAGTGLAALIDGCGGGGGSSGGGNTPVDEVPNEAAADLLARTYLGERSNGKTTFGSQTQMQIQDSLRNTYNVNLTQILTDAQGNPLENTYLMVGQDNAKPAVNFNNGAYGFGGYGIVHVPEGSYTGTQSVIDFNKSLEAIAGTAELELGINFNIASAAKSELESNLKKSWFY